MPRTTLVLAALGCAALLLASPIVAKPTPGHADDRGPPDHANAPDDPGPPTGTDTATGAADAGGEDEPDGSAAQPSTEEPSTVDASDPGGQAVATAEEPEPVSLDTAAPTSDAEPAQPTALGSASSPSGQWSGSTPAPDASDVFLVGPTLAVGLVALGMMARVRGSKDAETEATDDEEGSPEADGEDEAIAEDVDEPVTVEPPQPGPVGLLSLGRQALDRGDVEEAAGWFRTATMADPDRSTAHFCLGLCLADLDRLDEAEAALAEARRQNPGDMEATYAHAQVMARRGRTQAALRLLERLADDMPGFGQRLREDEDWACLHDHPRWLALSGELDLGLDDEAAPGPQPRR